MAEKEFLLQELTTAKPSYLSRMVRETLWEYLADLQNSENVDQEDKDFFAAQQRVLARSTRQQSQLTAEWRKNLHTKILKYPTPKIKPKLVEFTSHAREDRFDALNPSGVFVTGPGRVMVITEKQVDKDQYPVSSDLQQVEYVVGQARNLTNSKGEGTAEQTNRKGEHTTGNTKTLIREKRWSRKEQRNRKA